MNPVVPKGGIDPTTLPLKDIHLPLNIDWWPIAIGWWLLAFIILACAGFSYWYCRKNRLKRAALQALKAIQQQNSEQSIQQLSGLIRRISLQRYPNHPIAHLTGQKWLAWLDKPLKDQPFSKGVGRMLITAPYQSKPDLNQLPALFALTEQWIKTKDV